MIASLEASAAFIAEGRSLAAACRSHSLASRRAALATAEEIAGEILASGLAVADYPTHPRFAEFIAASNYADGVAAMVREVPVG